VTQQEFFNQDKYGERDMSRFTVLLREGGHMHDIYRPKDQMNEYYWRGARIEKPK
jgi:hypothetical protein